MKKIRRFILFFIGLALSMVVLDRLLRLGSARLTTGNMGVWNRAMSGRIHATMLITGSSRAEAHYDPKILGPSAGMTAFNLGRSGTLVDLQLPFLEAYLRHNRKPELLIQNLDVTSFQTSTNIYIPGQYVPYLHEPEIFREWKRIRHDAWKSRYLPLYGFVVDDGRFTAFQALGGLIGLRPAEDRPDGYLPSDRRWTSDFEKFKLRFPDGYTARIEPAGVEVFRRFLSLCETSGIPTVLVYSPEYSENQKWTRNRAELMDQFQKLANEYSVPLWDYSDHPICSDTVNFYNSQHLNQTGARRFSEDLAGRLGREFRNIRAPRRAVAAAAPPSPR